MFQFIVLAVVFITMSIGNTVIASDSVALIRNGQPSSIIVLADKPADSAKLGAEDLRMWLKKVSGAVVPIVSESNIEKNTEKSLILVGESTKTKELGIDAGTFEPEEFMIRTFPGALVILGDDERPDGVPLDGTLFAVETFTEEYIGVKLLWPGELGEVIPDMPTVEVRNIDKRDKPLLRRRTIRNFGHNSRLQRQLDILKWQSGDFEEFLTQSLPWFRFHRFGGNFRGQYGHVYQDYWERFHEDHPDWFALQPDGTRDNSSANDGRRARLCVSNRELGEQIARDCIEKLKVDPTLDTASISPNDGGRATYCLCEKCEAMDVPDAEMVLIWSPDGGMQHVSLTDRYVKFYSAIAEIVTQELPDRYLGAYAYAAYDNPPVNARLHPNVVLGFVPRPGTYLNNDLREKMLHNWEKWSEVSNQLFLRPNILMAGHNFPTVFPHRLAEDMRFFAEHKMLFADFDCCYHNWSTLGLNYYVLAKLLWDPYRDVDDIIDDYCRAGFGPSAQTIHTYFDKLEQITNEIAAGRDFIRWRTNPEVLAEHYTDDIVNELNALLDRADRQARGDDLIRNRIGFLRTGLEYVPISRDYILARTAARNGNSGARKMYEDARTKRIAWFQELGYSWTLSVPLLMYHDF